jgi:hypothetical protein
MTPVLAPVTLYRHPDGWTIQYAENMLIATDDEDNFVIVPIGKHFMHELIGKLEAIAHTMKGEA